MEIEQQCQMAKQASGAMAACSTADKNAALLAMADALDGAHAAILLANHADIQNGQSSGLSTALLDRSRLTEDRLLGVANSLRDIVALPDPVGHVSTGFRRPNGLQIIQQSVPIGVIGIIYEARPNVTVDAIGLAIKSGNAVVLRGSQSASHTNRALVDVLVAAAVPWIPDGAVQLLQDTSRDGVSVFLGMRDCIDVMIPRGGSGLIQRVVHEATMPTIETGEGVCHVYVDDQANVDQALAIVLNAKTQRPSVCNACETVLVHESLAHWVPTLVGALVERGVTVRGCPGIQACHQQVVPAQDLDWGTEYLDLIVAMKLVPSCDAAIQHINHYGSKHSEVIVSDAYASITAFTNRVDAAAVLVNASSRFTDGGEFGFGTEMGISTQKLHVRGPVGLHHLTTTKYIVYGTGHVRQ
jgi:glutamate-5-semialdehyde dehydrogenase